MAGLKTVPTDVSVSEFVASISDPKRRAECETVLALMAELSGERPVLWAGGIVGFGTYHYRYASGREGDWMRLGFAPRKQNLTLYLMDGFEGHADLLARLGKHTTGMSCLYLRWLADVDMGVLRELVRASLAAMDREYPR